ncbi:MAG: UTP--glucose-1-phosphate uridylyltransferase [Verrucomicrobia bacterium]|nr:UTP--glucose-1-phosphate uridylyltransferase [Verrucomicrobiota bacterium]
MKIHKAIITAAGANQRSLPLQTLVDRDGVTKSALAILAEEVTSAGIEEIAVIVSPGTEDSYAASAGPHARRMRFIVQPKALGYGHAVHCAADFTGRDPFLLMVGDHLHISRTGKSCAQQLIASAQAEKCSVSAVQATHERKLQHYGCVGGHRVPGRERLYEVEAVLEKPTPTEAEQKLVVPGLRAGRYLCFFGLHVFTPAIMAILARHLAAPPATGTSDLTGAAAELARCERYLAHELQGTRHDIGQRYGLLDAQLALALAGNDRDEVLTHIVELLAKIQA